MWQFPADATGVAIATLVYSVFSWTCNWLMIWLAWVHNERLSYVACISYVPLVSTLGSIIQQLHEYIWWEEVAEDEWKNRIAKVGNPTLVISNGAVGADLVLFYIQYYCYIVEATLVLFWAFSLTASVYGWSANPRHRKTFKRINNIGKAVSVILPLITVCLLQLRVVQDTYVAFIVIADVQFIVSCAGGAVLLLMILTKYIHTRRQFQTWTVGYGEETLCTEIDTRRSYNAPRTRSKSIYDRWLVIRFTIAFVALATYECAISSFQVTGQHNNTTDFLSPAPVVSSAKAIRACLQDLPGVSASLIPFVVFGTTRQFRKKMYDTFVPRCLRRRPSSSDTDSLAFVVRPRSMSQPSRAAIRVSKGVDISYSMNEVSPTPSSSNYGRASEDDDAILPVPASPARIPAKGPWEGHWEPAPKSPHGVRWHISSGSPPHGSSGK